MSFLAELKRRKVLRVAVAYAIVAWLLVQVVVTIKAPLNLPAWFDTVTIVLLAICFPVALILSWAFDWTRQGIVRDTGSGALPIGEPPTALPDSEVHSRERERKTGQTLRELIAAGPMSTSRLLSLAVRIANALAGAHANEVLHGALRPADILVKADDQVELVGFGLADGGSPGDVADASAYMAPERARGEAADDRSDQFSFGAVLYEMATGRRAFDGATEVETLAAVIHVDPEPVSRFNPDAPMPLQWAIERCLAKNPRDRYPSMRNLCTDLASIAETVKTATSARFVSAHNLPAPRTPLIGRERELGELKELVLEGGARLVTLTGAGGIGKTRLLIELGREVVESFRGGVFCAPLDRLHDAELATSEIAKAMSVQQVSDRPAAAALENHLRQYCVAPTLLLIDNFEHLLDAAPLLTELLAASEQLQIVVTSRAALRVYGEHEFRVAPLAVSHARTAAQLAQSPAVKLFLERAKSLRGNLSNAQLETVAEICERLDGLPLAIELAAARTKVLSLSGLLERIRDPLRLLSGGPRDLPARQQTLRATLEWSYKLLDEDQQKLFRRLGVFVGGATLEAIEAVCNVNEDLDIDLLEAVQSLVDNSLLRPMEAEQREPRFTMFETMREYVLGRLVEAGEDAHTRRAHAAYCLVLAEESSNLPTAALREALYDRLEREIGNLRAALDWLIAAGDAKWGLRLASALGHYWLQRGHGAEGYERFLKLLALSEASKESELRVWALSWAGDLAVNCGQLRDGERYHEEGLALARKLQVVPAVLRNLNALAIQTQQQGDFDRSKTYHEEAIEIAREGGSAAILGGMLSNYADHAMVRGDYDLAQRLHEETSRLFSELGDEAALAWSLNHQGDVARARRNFDAARRLYDDSLAKFRGLHEREGTAVCLYDLAALAADMGDCVEAEKLNGEALSLYWQLGHRTDVPRVLDALARCALESNDAERALTLAGSAAAMRQTLSVRAQEAAQVELDSRLDAARQHLAASNAAASWMAGWGMQPDQAVAFALREEQPVQRDSV